MFLGLPAEFIVQSVIPCVIVSVALGFAAVILSNAWKASAEANHRIADGIERHNEILSGKSEIPAIRGEIAAAHEKIDDVSETTGRHAKQTDHNIGVLAESISEVAEEAGGKPPTALDNIVLAGTEWTRREQPDGVAGFGWASDEQLAVSAPEHATASFRRLPVTGEVGEHTGAIRHETVAAALPQLPIPLDMTNADTVWETMCARIDLSVPGAMPWHVDPQTRTWPSGPHTFYDMERAQMERGQSPELPRDMLDLWPSLRNHQGWLRDHSEQAHRQ